MVTTEQVSSSFEDHSVIEEEDDDDEEDEDEESEVEESEEEEQLVPPPSSWFETPNPTLTNDRVEKSTAFEQDTATPLFPPPPPPQEQQDLQQPQESTNQTIGGMQVPIHSSHHPHHQNHVIRRQPVTHPSPSWKEISSQVLPAAARELLSSSLRRIYYTARLSYSRGRWHRKYSDIHNNTGGFSVPTTLITGDLPPFSSLPWVDRQLVQEWRTFDVQDHPPRDEEEEDVDFDRARVVCPKPLGAPKWQKQEVCNDCHKPFGPTRLRHHCRLCGHSYCQMHSHHGHSLPHLGYDPDVPERVCDVCKRTLLEQNLAERVAWRLARCRDYANDDLTPYFETGIDTYEQVALRITKAALLMARSIPLGAQATVAVETVEVLRKYGLNGIYGIMLRQEFLAAADLLRRALGINITSWPLSVHELTAAIFYALAQHRAMRGLNPEHEHLIHSLRPASQQNAEDVREQRSWTGDERDGILKHAYAAAALSSFHNNSVIDQTDIYNPQMNMNVVVDGMHSAVFDRRQQHDGPQEPLNFTPVCDPVPDHVVASLLFYAPIALNFIYATKEVDMQLLAAQQGWRLLYAFLEQDKGHEAPTISDRPASALFVHHEFKIVCLAIRGTATINDVITDIRQIPVPFPDNDPNNSAAEAETEDDWTNIFRGQGLALCGMAAAAVNLFREHIDSLVMLARKGYRIRITGHSLGGGVATMIGVLVRRHLKRDAELGNPDGSGDTLEERDMLRVYAYGTPSCVDAKLADSVNTFVTTVVLHDDIFPRLTPTSCRGLLKHLLHIRETWVKTHMADDLMAIHDRAKTAWAPRFRQGFTLKSSSRSLKRYCRKKMVDGKKQLLSVKDKLVGDMADEELNEEHKTENSTSVADSESFTSDSNQWGEKFFLPASNLSKSQGTSESDQETGETENEEEPEPQLLLEFLGGIDNRTQGIVIDGDEFFDTEEKLVESDPDDSTNSSTNEGFDEAAAAVSDGPLAEGDSWSLDMQQEVEAPVERKPSAKPAPAVDSSSSDEGPSAVVLEETPLPRMFVPGKIIHIYAHRGVYKTAYVPRTFRELRRISLAGNMLTNHTAKSYYEGLLEVQTARAAPEGPPRWTAFDEDDTW
jgi:hypothetical protein